MTADGDDTFDLYDLRVEVVATDRPMVCQHVAGEAGTLEPAGPGGQQHPPAPGRSEAGHRLEGDVHVEQVPEGHGHVGRHGATVERVT